MFPGDNTRPYDRGDIGRAVLFYPSEASLELAGLRRQADEEDAYYRALAAEEAANEEDAQ